MSNLVAFSQAGLPAVSTLSTALRSIQADVGPAGTAILKMDKTGHWVFGADQTEVEDDAKWAVNPFSFVHGFIAWGDGEVLGEKMTSVSNPLPELDEAPPQAKKGWESQVGMSLKCISGEDKGMEARFTTTSVGGKKAVQAIAVALAEQVEKDVVVEQRGRRPVGGRNNNPAKEGVGVERAGGQLAGALQPAPMPNPEVGYQLLAGVAEQGIASQHGARQADQVTGQDGKCGQRLRGQPGNQSADDQQRQINGHAEQAVAQAAHRQAGAQQAAAEAEQQEQQRQAVTVGAAWAAYVAARSHK